MTDREKIKAEVERLLNKVWKWHSSIEGKYRCEVYKELIEFIDSLPEEPSGILNRQNNHGNRIQGGLNMTKEEYLEKLNELTIQYAQSKDYENVHFPIMVKIPLIDTLKIKRVEGFVSLYLVGLE